jgi:hypothetical protein
MLGRMAHILRLMVLVPPAESLDRALPGADREISYIGTDTRFVVNLASGQRVVARPQYIPKRGLGVFPPVIRSG